MRRGPRRTLVAAAVAGVLLLGSCVGADPSDDRPPARRPGGGSPPNVILVVTDDQTAASMHGTPVAMPWLTERLAEPGWTTFRNAVVTTPLCCPSRATLLTGRTARRTGVFTNDDGAALDERTTIAARLHAVGYETAMIGKYLNGYPWPDRPLVPAGWDRWFAKLNRARSTTYYGYDVVDGDAIRTVGRAPEDYATNRLAAEATGFVRDAPPDRPFFLYFAPSAPHDPAEPAPRHAGLADAAPTPPDDAALAAMNDTTGAPGWIADLPPIDRDAAAVLAAAELRSRIALRAVDDGLRALWEAVAARGELGRTVWIFTSDSGYSFGDRRWVGKTCPWETCLHVPLVVHAPGTPGGSSDALVGNVDVAPTIAELAGLGTRGADGVGLTGHLAGGPPPERRALLLEWTGHATVPAWVGVRLPRAVFIRHADGTEELYDLASDPHQRRNLAGRPAASALAERAARLLDRSLVGAGGAR